MRIAVTGAYGYSGRYIAKRLLDAGHSVLTLTNSLQRENTFGDKVQAVPYNFDQPTRLTESLRGVDALINTYWVRFNHPRFSQLDAVANTKVLFQAAKDAGVRRIVHVSITNPDLNSDLPYFRGKAELELTLKNLGVPHCILRPAVLFGREDILVNNIAWSLRYFPVFGVFGSGNCRMQPIYVDDLAELAVRKADETANETLNAIGPETFTYRGLAETIRRVLDLHRLIVGVPPELGYWACRLMGLLVRDIIVTRNEMRGLMEEHLYVDAPPTAPTRLTDWLAQHKGSVGRKYTSEMARRIDRVSAYRSN